MCLFFKKKKKVASGKEKTEDSTHQLQSAYEDKGAPSAAAAHCVGGLDSDSEPAEKGWRKAEKPV